MLVTNMPVTNMSVTNLLVSALKNVGRGKRTKNLTFILPDNRKMLRNSK